MKKKINLRNVIFIIMLVSSCSDERQETPTVTNDIFATWTVTEVYKNNGLNGPFAWEEPIDNKRIRFTNDFKYYVETDGEFQLLASFKIFEEGQLSLYWKIPVPPQLQISIYTYEFDSDNNLILSTGATSGTIKEKFVKG